jgi:dTDP-4-dehydrorhamnose reductase
VILIFGGNGQLGRELARTAAQRRIAIAALGRAEADIADPDAVARAIAAHRPSLIVNAAAYTKVDQAETDVTAASCANERGPAVVAEACAAAAVPLVHLSTDYVFDGTKTAPYVETDPLAPIGVYGRTKAAGEAAVRGTLERHLILRTAWVYGEFGNNFLKTIVRLAQARDELRVVADQHGCPTSTRDLADAILRLAPRLIATDEGRGTYHYAGSGVTTWHEFASRIVAAQAPLTGRKPTVVAITTADYPTAARRPPNSTLDCSSFALVFGFSPRSWVAETDEITRAVVTSLGGRQHVA